MLLLNVLDLYLRKGAGIAIIPEESLSSKGSFHFPNLINRHGNYHFLLLILDFTVPSTIRKIS